MASASTLLACADACPATLPKTPTLNAHFHLQAGPELEIPGYGCEDHFAENDTLEHSWELLAELIKGGRSDGIVCDLGMPVLLGSVRYNCRVYLLDGRLLLIRPKISLADDGNYRCVQERAWRSRGLNHICWQVTCN